MEALAAAGSRTSLFRRTAALRLRGSRASVAFTVLCPAGAVGGCRGTLTLVSVRRVPVLGARARIVLGTKAFRIAAGRRRAIVVPVPAGARSLARRGVIAARAELAAASGATSVAVRLRVARASG